MYSNASDKLSYLKRVASHATKPLRNGRINLVPKNAEPVESNSVLRQYCSLMERLQKSGGRDADIRRQLEELRQHPDVSFLQIHREPEPICEKPSITA
jgi:hypothetical protein